MAIIVEPERIETLSSYRHCIGRIEQKWPDFLARRRERLQPHPLLGDAAEKLTESILEDLLTDVLDWPLSSFVPQIKHADIVLAGMGIKRLIIEAKRPGSLAWNKSAVERALAQVRGYAAEQKVKSIAVSDGTMFYAADLADGGMRDRIFVSLDEQSGPHDLYWISSAAIYRERECVGSLLRLLPESGLPEASERLGDSAEEILHHKYKLPARCFAFVADASNPATWKLPYLNCDGSVDAKRLPKAIQSILTNYRGAKVCGIPEEAIPAVLTRLAAAAEKSGHLSKSNVAAVYRELIDALNQLGIPLGRE